MVIQGMRKLCGRIIIGVGSTDGASTKDNPFSAEERHEMISAALLDADIPDADIYDIPETTDHSDWVDAVLKTTGPIDTVWTGNEVVGRLFKEKGINVQKIKEVPGISATLVRERLLNGGEWDALVPDGVASVLRRIGAMGRMKELKGLQPK